MEDEDYIEHYFRIVDNKITISNVNTKKRGRKKGYKHNEETKEKIAEKMRDRVKSPEEKIKISNKLRGRKKDIETIRKISRKKRGTWPSDDLLKDYTTPSRKEDRDWLHNHMSEKDSKEIRQWILDHYEKFNEIAEDNILTYKDLRALTEKEKVELSENCKDVRGEIKA